MYGGDSGEWQNGKKRKEYLCCLTKQRFSVVYIKLMMQINTRSNDDGDTTKSKAIIQAKTKEERSKNGIRY